MRAYGGGELPSGDGFSWARGLAPTPTGYSRPPRTAGHNQPSAKWTAGVCVADRRFYGTDDEYQDAHGWAIGPRMDAGRAPYLKAVALDVSLGDEERKAFRSIFDGMTAQIDLSGKHAVTKARAQATLSGHTPLKRTGRKVPETRSA